MKNKLVIFAYDFPPSSGGIARLCYEIALGQKKYFDEVVVLTRKKTGEQNPLKESTFSIIELPEKRISCEIKAIKILKSFSKASTIILTSLWYPEAFLSLLSGHKNIYSLAHGAELLSGNSNFRKKIWIPFFAKKVLSKVKKVIANSHYTSSLVTKISPKSNSLGLPLAVDTNQFFPLKEKVNDGMLHISTLSRVHKFKGYDQIFSALNNLEDNLQKQVVWHIGGTGSYLKDFKEKVANSSINFKVVFHGFVPDNDLNKFYNKSNLFILFTQDSKSLNNIEGFGLVFLEAQAAGIPAIGTKTGGIPDAIDSENGGWLLEQNNVIGLSNLISKLIKEPDYLKSQSVKARERVVKNCQWSMYNKKLTRILQ